MPTMSVDYYSNISEKLAQLCVQIRQDNPQNITILNIFAEGFFAAFLNLLYGWNLKIPENANNPGFDLIDEENRIIVQVSSECTRAKIQKALDDSKDKKDFHFYFVVISEKRPKFKKDFDVPKNLQFEYKKHILDTTRLMKYVINSGDIEKQKKLYELVEQYFGRTAPLRELDKPVPSRDPGIVDELEYFQRNWTANAFLTNGVPLKDIYYPPQCYLNWSTKKRLGLTEAGSRLNNSRKKALLILGQPGIGKSTLISRFVSTYPGKRQIIVYRCRKLGIKNWNNETIYQTVLSQAALSGINLSSSILILDGLDEVAGKETLDATFKNLVSSHCNSIPREQAAYLVITCRENYIQNLNAAKTYDYIRLCPFNKEQIQGFCKDYGKTVKKTVPAETVLALCKNETVYGIPFIAYMVLALGIKANANSGIVDVYDQIFDPKEGSESSIYNRPYDLGADTGGKEMWQKLHKLSQDMALWIFHNNFEKEEIPKDRLDRFAEECGLEPQKGLDHFRKLHHSESGNQSVTFIHRSMMEYFVADAIAREICPDRSRPADKPSDAIEKVSGMLYWRDIHSGECAEYLSKMLEVGFGKLKKVEKEEAYREWELAVFQQLEAGVPFQRIPEKNQCSFAIRLQAEKRYCNNLIWVLRNLWELCRTSVKIGFYARKQMGKNRYCTVLPLYIQLNPLNFDVWHLRNCDLIDADLHNMYLRGADLRGAYLRDSVLHSAILNNADMVDAHLVGANLCDARLIGAYLNDADLRGAHLNNAYLSGADLSRADLSGAYLDNALLDRDSAFKAIEELRVANFDSIRIWDKGTLTTYTREEFFAAFDK